MRYWVILFTIYGLSIAQRKTNEFSNQERAKLSDSAYVKFLKQNDECLGREYIDNKRIVVVLSDIQFEEELILNLGGLTAKIFYTVSPHSEDTVLIYIPEEKILFLGDATSEDFFNNGYRDKDKLKTLINLIESIDCRYCI